MGRRSVMLWAVTALGLACAVFAAGAAQESVTITVKNETGYYLVEVNRATEDEPEWSPSVLGDGVAIRPNKEMDVRIEPGFARVRALFDVDGTEVEVVEEADFEADGEYIWTVTEDMIWESYGDEYSDTYGYWDDTYGYWDDTYGYYDDTYGYYDDTYGYYGENSGY